MILPLSLFGAGIGCGWGMARGLHIMYNSGDIWFDMDVASFSSRMEGITGNQVVGTVGSNGYGAGAIGSGLQCKQYNWYVSFLSVFDLQQYISGDGCTQYFPKNNEIAVEVSTFAPKVNPFSDKRVYNPFIDSIHCFQNWTENDYKLKANANVNP